VLIALGIALVPMLLALVLLALAFPLIYSQLSLLVGLIIAAVAGIVALCNMELLAANSPEPT
jgi:hypothetical protein